MIAPSRQLRRIDEPLPRPVRQPVSPNAWLVITLTGLMGFFCFMPYTSLPIGNRTSLQIGNLISIALAAPLIFAAWRQRPFWIYILVAAPLCLSMLHVAISGSGDAVLSAKAMSVWLLVAIMLISTQLHAPVYPLALLTGAAIATLVHFVVGVWQYFAFKNGEFPLVWLYVNPSFLSVQENAENIARWNQRPFGVFPEPSAMSSSLAPWLLFWMAYLLKLVKLHKEPARWQRMLFAGATVGGLALIILSQSGHAAITLAAASVFISIWFIRSKATRRTLAAFLLIFGIAAPLVIYAAMLSLSTRVGGSELGNSSWEDRFNSLIIGFNLWTKGDLGTFIWGFGLGQTSPVLQREWRMEAVWSVLLIYIYETGVIGLASVAIIGTWLIRMWRQSAYSVVFATITLVWLVGITITTSYLELLSLWMTLAWLSVWPAICPPTRKAAEPVAMRSEPEEIESIYVTSEESGNRGLPEAPRVFPRNRWLEN